MTLESFIAEWKLWVAIGTLASCGLGLLVGAVLQAWAPLDMPDAVEEERRAAALSTYLEGP